VKYFNPPAAFYLHYQGCNSALPRLDLFTTGACRAGRGRAIFRIRIIGCVCAKSAVNKLSPRRHSDIATGTLCAPWTWR